MDIIMPQLGETVAEGTVTKWYKKVGDTIKVSYRLTGRKWQRDEQSEVKFFLSAEAMEYELIRDGGGAGSAAEEHDEADFGPDDGSAPF